MQASNSPQFSNTKSAAWRTLPAAIWALGFGSLFMDMSSEFIHDPRPAK